MKDWKAIAKENGIYSDLFMRRVRNQGWSPEKAAITPPRQEKHFGWLKKAERNGITQSTFYSRINRSGWTPEKAATEPLQKNQPRPNDKWVRLAKANGISKETYYERIGRMGWTPEKAATTELKGNRPDSHLVKFAEENGIHRRTYTSRVDDCFWDPEEAATTPPMTSKEMTEHMAETRRAYTLIRHERINKDPNNLFKLTPQLYKEAENRGISRWAVEKRVYRHGWTVDEAINTPIRKWDEKPEGFDEWLKVALTNGIAESTCRSRVRGGWSLEDAAQEVRNRKTLNSVQSQKLIDKAEANGISAKRYRARINRGWTEEEASTISLLKSGQFKDEETKEKVHAEFKKFRTNTSM